MAREVALPLEIEEARHEPRKRLKRFLSTARKHPLGVFGLACVGLFFFCGVFADLIVPYDPEATLRETQTFGTLAERIEPNDTRFTVAGAQLEVGTNFGIDGERMTVVPPEPRPTANGKLVNEKRASSNSAHEAV